MAILIRTFSGKQVDLENFRFDKGFIPDVAHSLSNTCRFRGHTIQFYSVAEHSVHVSRLTEKLGGDPLAGLFHDASEFAYADILSPEKPLVESYKRLEHAASLNIMDVLGGLKTDSVKLADNFAREVEGQALMKGWSPDMAIAKEFSFSPECWLPNEAERMFMERFFELQYRRAQAR
jgi:hypothetical protein